MTCFSFFAWSLSLICVALSPLNSLINATKRLYFAKCARALSLASRAFFS